MFGVFHSTEDALRRFPHLKEKAALAAYQKEYERVRDNFSKEEISYADRLEFLPPLMRDIDISKDEKKIITDWAKKHKLDHDEEILKDISEFIKLYVGNVRLDGLEVPTRKDLWPVPVVFRVTETSFSVLVNKQQGCLLLFVTNDEVRYSSLAERDTMSWSLENGFSDLTAAKRIPQRIENLRCIFG